MSHRPRDFTSLDLSLGGDDFRATIWGAIPDAGSDLLRFFPDGDRGDVLLIQSSTSLNPAGSSNATELIDLGSYRDSRQHALSVAAISLAESV